VCVRLSGVDSVQCGGLSLGPCACALRIRIISYFFYYMIYLYNLHTIILHITLSSSSSWSHEIIRMGSGVNP